MRPVDWLIAGYLVLLTLLMVVRGHFGDVETWLLFAMHALFGVLLYLFTRLRPEHRVGHVVHDLYPLFVLPVFYTELGILNLQLGIQHTFAHDAIVQRWEAAVFGSQISYDWIRNAPSVFWSGLLHLSYLSYYAIVGVGPLVLVIRSRSAQARTVLLAIMLTFVACYALFALFPVAGPNYAFPHPTGPVREVWSARLVYEILGQGSSFGTAFPSSHVAAAVAATLALWYEWRRLSRILIALTMLMIVSTVYCQMHYGVDAAAGVLFGVAGGWVGTRLGRRSERRAEGGELRDDGVGAADREIERARPGAIPAENGVLTRDRSVSRP